MYYLYAIVFTGFLSLFWVLTLLGLPGNWLMVAAALGFYWGVPQDGVPPFAPSLLYWLAGLALLGEVLEFATSALGLARGGSRRGALYSIAGAFLGSILGAAVGLPVPLIGSALGIVLFAAVGAMAGTLLGEKKEGRSLQTSLPIGKAAFWGKILGSIAKLGIGGVIAVLAAAAVFLR